MANVVKIVKGITKAVAKSSNPAVKTLNPSGKTMGQISKEVSRGVKAKKTVTAGKPVPVKKK